MDMFIIGDNLVFNLFNGNKPCADCFINEWGIRTPTKGYL